MFPNGLYPDNGELLEDRRVLRNAIQFSTGQRAFMHEALLDRPLDEMEAESLAYAATEAYAQEQLAIEDLLGWHLVLRDWIPGTPDHSLVYLLDRVEVGPRTESELETMLLEMDVSAYRQLIHVPDDDQLLAVGLAADDLPLVPRQLTAQLAGVRKLVQARREENRGRVIGYNKLKHVLVGIYRPPLQDVLVPARLKLQPDGLHMMGLTIAANPENVRRLAGRALATTAVLNVTLGLVLWARFGEPYIAPGWCKRAEKRGIWSS